MNAPNRDILMGKWKQLRGRVRIGWGKLRDNKMDQIGGSYQRLVGVLQENYGEARQKVSKQANRLRNRNGQHSKQRIHISPGRRP